MEVLAIASGNLRLAEQREFDLESRAGIPFPLMAMKAKRKLKVAVEELKDAKIVQHEALNDFLSCQCDTEHKPECGKLKDELSYWFGQYGKKLNYYNNLTKALEQGVDPKKRERFEREIKVTKIEMDELKPRAMESIDELIGCECGK